MITSANLCEKTLSHQSISQEPQRISPQKIGYVRALFSTYSKMEDRIAYNEKLVHRIAEQSAHSFMNTEAIVDKILARLVRKETLVRLKKKVEKLLESLPEKNATVIRLYFFEKMNTSRITEEIGLSKRTTFRVIEKSLATCVENLECVGLNTTVFNSLLREYKWLENEYHNQLSQALE